MLPPREDLGDWLGALVERDGLEVLLRALVQCVGRNRLMTAVEKECDVRWGIEPVITGVSGQQVGIHCPIPNAQCPMPTPPLPLSNGRRSGRATGMRPRLRARRARPRSRRWVVCQRGDRCAVALRHSGTSGAAAFPQALGVARQTTAGGLSPDAYETLKGPSTPN